MKELTETQLVHVSRVGFLKEQMLFFIGSIFILIAAFISFFSYAPFKSFRLLFWAYIFTMIIFVFLKAKAYYAIGLYPIFLAFGAVYLSKLLQQGWKFSIRYFAVAIILVFSYPLVETALPIYAPEKYAQFAQQNLPFSSHIWEDGKKYPISQDFADMLGWKELANKTDSVYNSLANKNNVLIICDNYGQAGAINYYTKINGVKADCFNTDYEKWVNLNDEIKTVIRIKTANNLGNTRDLLLFGSINEVAKIENQFARENGTRIIILSNPKIDLAKLLREERAKGNLR